MNEQYISRDTNGRPKDNDMPSEPGGREEAWQTRTEDMGGQPSGYTAGDKRQDRDLTQPDQNQGYSEGRDQSMRGR